MLLPLPRLKCLDVGRRLISNPWFVRIWAANHIHTFHLLGPWVGVTAAKAAWPDVGTCRRLASLRGIIPT